MGSLYGSLFTGSSGLNSQSSAIAIIADNITNSNTVGYKAGNASFSTFVTNNSSSNSYSSGGVNTSNTVLINQQGVIQATGSVSDLAISGNGFFVVNTKEDGSGTNLLTKAGSFTTDKNGNYVNTAGFTLLGWPLDSSGRLPGAAGNLNTTSSTLLTSLKPVNINSISSTSNPTKLVNLGLNLKSSHAVLNGANETIAFPTTSTENYGIAENDIISYEDTYTTNILNYGDSITLTPSSTGTSTTYTYGGFWMSGNITAGAGILGALTATQNFTGATKGWNFYITTGSGTTTYTYEPNTPDTAAGQFNNLTSLADAINHSTGMTAKIDKSTNYLYFGPKDATQSWSMTDITGTFVSSLFNGTGGPPAVVTVASGTNRFSTLAGLKSLIGVTNGLGTVESNPLGNTTLEFYTTDPLGTLTVSATGSAAGAGGPGSGTPLVNPATSTAATILATFGLNNTSPLVIPAAYDPTGLVGNNIASGKIASAYTVPVQMYDSLGTQHDFEVSFVKLANNKWSVEIYTKNLTDIVSSKPYGQVATGTIEFNGDGTLKSVSNALSAPISISWANQADTSSVSFNWGTAGQEASTVGATTIGASNGLSQADSPFNSNFITQDGNISGTVSSMSFDQNGYVIANFTNGSSRNVFQIPLATVPNANGLSSVSGNAFSLSLASGVMILKEANTGGTGQIVPSSLEQSNVNLSNELTNMIIAQKGYQASAKVMKTSSDMLDDLNRALT